MLICYRLSVCHTGGSVKMVEVRIMKFSPLAPPLKFLLVKFHPEILTASLRVGHQKGRGGENKPFSSFKHQYLENGSRYVQSYYY